MKKGVAKLKEEQIKLAKKIKVKDDFDKLELVAGVDQTFIENNKKIISSVVVMDYKTKQVIEKESVIMDTTFPYIHGLLSYRESPAIIQAISKLKNKPDVLLIDGHGICHPRKIGMASHTGLLLDIPTIGVAKNLLCGEIKGGKIYIDDEIRGKEVKTKEQANPIYISPGYRISLKTAVEIINNCMNPPHKYPEPLYLAHRYAKKQK